jgi:hypothetical protein
MGVKGYVKGDKKGLQISTLDHKPVNECYEGIQIDGTSCGCWTLLDMVNKTTYGSRRLTMGTAEEVLNVRLTFFTVVMKIIKLICDQNDFKEGNIAKFDNKSCVVSLIIQYHDDYTVNDRAKLMDMIISQLKSISHEIREGQGIAEKNPLEICNAINLRSDFEKEKQK